MKLKKYLIVLIAGLILTAGIASAQSFAWNFWRDNGLGGINPAWDSELGDTTDRISKIWLDDLDATAGTIGTLTISSVANGPLIITTSTDPVIRFKGDADTGYSWLSDGILAITADGTNIMIMSSTSTTMGGNIIMPEDGWIGIGAATERIAFDGGNNSIRVFDSNFHIGNDQSNGFVEMWADNDSAELFLVRDDDTVSSNNALGEIFFGGDDADDPFLDAASIKAKAQADWTGSGHTPTTLGFYTLEDGGVTSEERLWIDHNGDVYIGNDPSNVNGGDFYMVMGATVADSVFKMDLNAAGTLTMTTDTQHIAIMPATGVGVGTTSPKYMLETVGTSTDGFFGVSQNTAGDIFTIDNSGNVGIGTDSPDKTLDIRGDVMLGANNKIWFSNTNVANTNRSSIRNPGADTVAALEFGVGVGVAMSLLTSGEVGIGTTTPNAHLAVYSDGTQALTTDFFRVGTSSQDYFIVDNNGNVGIGTTSPSQRFVVSDGTNEDFIVNTDGHVDILSDLHLGTDHHETIIVNGVTKNIQFGVHGDDIANEYVAYLDRASNTHAPTFFIARARGSHTAPSIVADGDILGQIGFGGWDGTGADMNIGAQIRAVVDGTPGNDDMPTELLFRTTADGDATSTTNMVIKADGNVGIGTTDPIYSLSVAGEVGAYDYLTRPNYKTAKDTYKPCPLGYILVPGSEKYGTADFCVMKYEARECNFVDATTTDCSSQTKADGSGDPADEQWAASYPENKPWITIQQDADSAQEACEQIGTGFHLITNAEWMTIADNIIHTQINDLDKDTALYQLATGHTDDSPSASVTSTAAADPTVSGCNLNLSLEETANAYASTSCELRGNGPGDHSDNAHGYYGTEQNWSTTYSPGAANASQLRTHVLSNGEVIWDLAGNVWEWTDDTVTNTHMIESSSGITGWDGYFAADSDTGYLTNAQGFNIIPNISTSYTANNHGIGRIYIDIDDADPSGTTHAFLRGGCWYNTSDAGVFTLHLYHAPAYTYTAFGFRCAR